MKKLSKDENKKYAGNTIVDNSSNNKTEPYNEKKNNEDRNRFQYQGKHKHKKNKFNEPKKEEPKELENVSPEMEEEFKDKIADVIEEIKAFEELSDSYPTETKEVEEEEELEQVDLDSDTPEEVTPKEEDLKEEIEEVILDDEEPEKTVTEEDNEPEETVKEEEIEEPIIPTPVEEVKEEKVKVENTRVENKNINGGKLYLSFSMRFAINAAILVFVLLIFGYSLFMSFSTTKNEVVKYKVNSDIDYKVYLKDNDFYDTNYLGKGMVYVSSLIKDINVDYKYNFNIDKASDIDFTYKVVAKVVIASQTNSNVFFEKEYDLTDEKTETIKNASSYTIKENIDLNYVYYNNLANKFRSNYAVNTNSYLEVYLVVNEKSKDNNVYDLKNQSKAVLTVPLSLQELNITLNNKNVNEEKELVIPHNEGISTLSTIFIIILIVVIVIASYELTKKILIVTSTTNKYDAYVNRILRGFDRIIVNVKTMPNFDDYNIVKVSEFQELVDVRDNLKVPINYFVITEHQKCEFYVYDNNKVYLYVLKAVDLEEGSKNEKEDTNK